MSRAEMAETLRDVMRAQQEEQGLLGDVRYIIEAMKTMSHTRDTSIRQLAQAHFDKTQQLKREHAYNMARLRTEKDREIENIRQQLVQRVEQSNDQAQKHWEAVLQLKQSNAYKMNVVKTEKERELAAVKTELTATNEEMCSLRSSTLTDILIEDKDRSISTLERRLDMVSRELSTTRRDNVPVSNLSKENLALQESNANLRSSVEISNKNLGILRENTKALVDGNAAARILKREIRDAKYSEPTASDLLWDSTMDARHQIKALKNMCTNRRTALKMRYDNLRHKKIELEMPLKHAQVNAAAEQYQKLVVKDMDDLIHWLDEMTEDLVRKDLRLMERTDVVYDKHEKERNVRLERLSALADICGVRNRLASVIAPSDDS